MYINLGIGRILAQSFERFFNGGFSFAKIFLEKLSFNHHICSKY
jgi:hypothetical protein